MHTEERLAATLLPKRKRLSTYPELDYVGGRVGEQHKTLSLSRGLEEFLRPLPKARKARKAAPRRARKPAKARAAKARTPSRKATRKAPRRAKARATRRRR